MVRYHIGSQGNPAACSAKLGNCPFGTDAPHGEFTSLQEAHSWAEELEAARHNDSFGLDGVHSKNTGSADLALTVPAELQAVGDQIDGEFSAALASKQPLSSVALGRRNSYVEKLTDHYRGQGESTDEKFATTRENGTVVYHTWRRKQQVELIRDFVAANVMNAKREGKAIFAGGLGGAGKGTVLAEQAGVDRRAYATINPDDIKELMAERGMIPTAGSLTPMEMSTLVHEEASEIAGEIAGVCQSRKINIIYDGTMGSERSVLKKVSSLQRSGYTSIDAIFVSIEPDTSLARGIQRYSEGINEHILGANNIGGRPLPAHVVHDQAPTSPHFRSKNEEVLVELHRRRVFSAEPRIYDNNTWGQEAREVAYLDFAT